MALRDGDRSRAVRHLTAAGRAPASEELQWSDNAAALGLVNQLLEAGERDAFVEFLENLARLSLVPQFRDRWLNDAKAIREGRMTSSYQTMIGRR